MLGVLSVITALAAPFGEPASQAAGGVTGCLTATGAPGELIAATHSGAVALQAGPAGVTARTPLPFDEEGRGCPAVAAQPNGAGVAAVTSADVSRVRAFLREPGGDWGPPVEALRPPAGAAALTPAVAVSARGDALVATSASRDLTRLRIVVARRAPGAGFGAPETVAATRAVMLSPPRVKVGVGGLGEAVIAWSVLPEGRPGARELWAATAQPGAPFGPPQRVGRIRPGSAFDLAVAADGRALLAFVSGSGMSVAERAPGGAFGAPARVGDADDPIAVEPAVALRSGGAAVVAWRGLYGHPAAAVVRERPGPFGAPATLLAAQPLGLSRFDPLVFALLRYYVAYYGIDVLEEGTDGFAGHLRAALTGDGRALLAWSALERRDGVWWLAPRSATLALGGGPAESRAHGSEARDASEAVPLLLAGGTAAVAWKDARSTRLHLGVEGAADGADRPAPRVRVGAPARRTLRDGAALILPVRCSAACEVRAQVAGGDFQGEDTIALARAGRGTLKLRASIRPMATIAGGPVRILVRYGTPGARAAEAHTLTVRLRRIREPLIRVVALTARRDGDDVLVRWRTARPAAADAFQVFGLATRDDEALRVASEDIGESIGERRRRSFRARLSDAARARWVAVLTDSTGLAVHMRRTMARVSR